MQQLWKALFASTHGTFTKTEHVLEYEVNLNEFKGPKWQENSGCLIAVGLNQK